MSFTPQPITLKQKILNFQKYAPTPYIHCSKLNSALQAIKQILNPICEYVDDKGSFTTKEGQAASEILKELDVFHDLLMQCPRDSCLTFLISSSIRTVKTEIKHFRENMQKSLETLRIHNAAKFMQISDQELDSQDAVDLKRIASILSQVIIRDKEQAREKLESRLKSLSELGVDINTVEKDTISIPELPDSLKLVITHESVVLGEKIGRGQSGSVYKGHFVNDDIYV